MIWVELDGGVCYELGDDSFLLNDGMEPGLCASSKQRRYQDSVRPARLPMAWDPLRSWLPDAWKTDLSTVPSLLGPLVRFYMRSTIETHVRSVVHPPL